jgi:hypothetical protein
MVDDWSKAATRAPQKAPETPEASPAVSSTLQRGKRTSAFPAAARRRCQWQDQPDGQDVKWPIPREQSFYTRRISQPIDAIGPDLRCVHGATSRAALSSCARCRTIALSRPPAPAQDCPGSCCAPPPAYARSPARLRRRSRTESARPERLADPERYGHRREDHSEILEQQR